MLFERLCDPAASQSAFWSHTFGRRVVAWDGTTIAVPDSPANAAAFGYQGQRSGDNAAPQATAPTKRRGVAIGANPLVRMVTLVECGSHALIDVAFDGVARASEQALVRRLLASLTPGMLLLADRNFLSYPLWTAALGTGADLLWRAKTSSYLVATTHLPDGSYLATLPTPAETQRLGALRSRHGRNEVPQEGHQVRVIEFTVTIHTDDATRTEQYRLLTTLLDHTEAPAEQLAALYHERWEAENSNSELKPRLIGAGTTLRSRTPEGVTQEIYALLCIYQALITLRVDAATTANLDPDRISFLTTIREVRADITNHSTHSQPTRRRGIIKRMIENQLSPRRHRSSPRQRVPRADKYPAKSRDHPQPSTKTRTEITISRTQDLK
jgi:hypothetical protein